MTKRYDPIALERLDLALHLEALSDAQMGEAINAEQIRTGAILIEPIPRGNWGPVEFELTMLGVFGTGLTKTEAGRNWARKVIRMAEHDSDNPTPRAA